MRKKKLRMADSGEVDRNYPIAGNVVGANGQLANTGHNDKKPMYLRPKDIFESHFFQLLS
jgi:hypothetical protein